MVSEAVKSGRMAIVSPALTADNCTKVHVYFHICEKASAALIG
jgi:hypothetical protein